MTYKVMDIFMDLPKTNCGYCGKPGCLAFATAVYLENFPLDACSVLEPGKLAEMREKLAEARALDQGAKEESVVQALAFLKDKIGGLDLPELAEKSGAEYLPGPPERLRVPLFGSPYLVGKEEVVEESGANPSVWVKVFLLIYSTRANGNPPAGKWAAFRELPNSVSKAKQFEETAGRLARRFEGKPEELREAALRLSGEEIEAESADLAFIFKALPGVPLQLLFWDGDEDFEARVTILLDKDVLDYLDQEAIVFLTEAMAALLLGEDLSEVAA